MAGCFMSFKVVSKHSNCSHCQVKIHFILTPSVYCVVALGWIVFCCVVLCPFLVLSCRVLLYCVCFAEFCYVVLNFVVLCFWKSVGSALFSEEARQSAWDNIVTCHRGDKQARTWSFQRKCIGSHQLKSHAADNKAGPVMVCAHSVFLYRSSKITRLSQYKLLWEANGQWHLVE